LDAGQKELFGTQMTGAYWVVVESVVFRVVDTVPDGVKVLPFV
jgi:hypothetical protein